MNSVSGKNAARENVKMFISNREEAFQKKKSD